jgi:hypothetical protein
MGQARAAPACKLSEILKKFPAAKAINRAAPQIALKIFLDFYLRQNLQNASTRHCLSE